ncbi:hypothetical protein [Bacillus cereus]|uniref:hypothetical protein n=1 Tax=Bacillus cereus TaxID=1396 RepID=UPI000951C4D2|nr:hypothetical protein [Bacillus cereus]OLR26023.1 hypothetical protein BLD50_09180 [Bacillus cereus]
MILEIPIDPFLTNHKNSVKELSNQSVENVETLSMGIKYFVQNHLQSVKEFIPQTIDATASIESIKVVAKKS